MKHEYSRKSYGNTEPNIIYTHHLTGMKHKFFKIKDMAVSSLQEYMILVTGFGVTQF
jgi:hypothetical protein